MNPDMIPGETVAGLAGSGPQPRPKSNPYDLVTITDSELAKKVIPPLSWIIPGLIPEGLSILVGHPKTGKSALVLGWAYAVSAGLPVMGRNVDKSGVLYLALEDNERRLQDRLRGLRDGGGPTSGLEYITMNSPTPFSRLDAGGKEMLEQHLDSHEDCRLVIIDTWARVKPGKRNRNQQEYDADSAAWSILHEIATRRRIAIIVLHHTRKPLKGDGDFINEISGTMGIAGTVDTILLLRRTRTTTTATLLVAGRDVDEEKEYVLHGDPATKAWKLGSDNAEEYRLSQAQREIIKILRAAPYLNPKDIATKLGLQNSDRIRPILKRMADVEIIILDTEGRYYLSATYASDSNGRNADIASDRHNESNARNGSNGLH